MKVHIMKNGSEEIISTMQGSAAEIRDMLLKDFRQRGYVIYTNDGSLPKLLKRVAERDGVHFKKVRG